ncbi:MAG: hypothetical protein WC816_13600 [Sphingomonas sp.]
MFSSFRRFVDWDLRRQPNVSAGALTLLIGMSPWLALGATGGEKHPPIFSAATVAIILFDLLWFGFVGWRAWALIRQAAAQADRLYDRKGKYSLPPEYADTESATKARQRPGKFR